jgi:hypothetical protein
MTALFSKDAQDYLYSFIVDSNLEGSCVEQCEDERIQKELARIFQIEEDD